MKWCEPCDRSFRSQEALDQHLRNSPAHTVTFDCEPCNRSFSSQEALDQHLRDAPAHAVTFDCEPCNRSFSSQDALDQHLRDAPAHALTFDCEPCNRSFSSQEALDQHLRDSPAHAVTFDCEPCNRSFGSQEALDQHLRDAPAHTVTFDCEPCNRSFGSQDALDQHLRDSPAHAQLSRTPLDIFFQSFDGFVYDPVLAPSESYSSLQRYYGWRRGERESDQAWQRFQEALSQEFKLWFGTENDLAAWHSLCRAVRIKPIPSTCLDCEKAVRGIYVNIVDLIDWARSGGQCSNIRLFRNLQDLRDYTKASRKIFHNNLDETGDGNVVLRHLLRFIFRQN